MSAPRVVVGRRTQIVVEPDAPVIVRCLVCGKRLNQTGRASKFCGSTCNSRAVAMRKRGEEPTGVFVSKKINPKSKHSKAVTNVLS